jgi:hypothetical protein
MTEAKTASFSIPGGTGAPSTARRSVISIHAGLPLGVRHRVALMLSEFVANAVEHGGAGAGKVVQVKLESTPLHVRVEGPSIPAGTAPTLPSASSTRTGATACS